MIRSMLAMGEMFMQEQKQSMNEWEDRILSEWENTKTMPRKKKKKLRKHLNLEYSIMCHGKELLNPFGI